ncbi:MAG: pitrilysin family protein [Oscillospiraceae bacterium]|nr:pitrilysin family protein [Oscillospiraceae bacterium]
MIFTEKKSERLGERYFTGRHESGLEIYLIPKDHKSAFALLGTRYGSIHRTFKTGADKDFITVPDGVAHFLEHKLFENEDGTDTFSLFGAMGASCNAFTSNEITAYLFSATDKYYENLEILLKFVTTPYFTKETVEKEIGIISQELRMYLDNPYRQLYNGLLNSMYVNSNVKIDVGGTEESISHITADILYRCYNTFYNLHNMTLCLCGDFNCDKVAKLCDKVLKNSPDIEISHQFPDEPDRPASKKLVKEFPIALPMFYSGIKEPDINLSSFGAELVKKDAEHRIICEMLFGKSSAFYNSLYEKGLINDKFSAGYNLGRTYGFFYCAAETREPDKVNELVANEIASARAGNFSEDFNTLFERSKRVVYSDAVQEWNSTSDIAENFLFTLFVGGDMLDTPNIIADITPADIFARLKRSYNTDNLVTSLIIPKK